MNYPNLKRLLISNRFGLAIDTCLRALLAIIPRFESVLRPKKRLLKPGCLVFFLHGGFGDVILTLDLIESVSRKFKIVVLIDERVADIVALLPSKILLLKYVRDNPIKAIKAYRALNITNPVFVQTSPVIEVRIIVYLLGVKRSIGLLNSYNEIRSIGLDIPLNRNLTQNRQVLYRALKNSIEAYFGEISQSRRFVEYQSHTTTPYSSLVPYVVISATKTSLWQMGKMVGSEYLCLAEYLVTERNLNVVFVGNHHEKSEIDQIIRETKIRNRIFNYAGKTNLIDLKRLLQAAEFYVGNDNGVSHLSAYLLQKTLVLFMFSDPEVYAWDHKNYSYIFQPMHFCMPCVGKNSVPKDNYPVRCRNMLLCNQSINHRDIVKKLKSLSWI